MKCGLCGKPPNLKRNDPNSSLKKCDACLDWEENEAKKRRVQQFIHKRVWEAFEKKEDISAFAKIVFEARNYRDRIGAKETKVMQWVQRDVFNLAVKRK